MRTHQPDGLSYSKPNLSLIIVVLLLASVFLSGCTLPGYTGSGETQIGVEKAQIIFSVTSLRPIAADEQVELVIVDEVTGLPYNQEHIPMSVAENGLLQASYQAPVGTVLTYRYEKITGNGARIPEVTVSGSQVSFRRYYVSEPAQFSESIAGWEDNLPDSSAVGSITGKVLTADLGIPVKDILVSAGGIQTVTDGEGNFTLTPLNPGQHNLVTISMTGTYLPFQNAAEVASGKVTPVEIPLIASAWREVTFNLEVPEDTIEGAPIRLAGNLSQLGNTFLNLGGGMSGDTKAMPMLEKTGKGKYTLTLTLPAGIDIRYKYTMGDGFWNSEHGMNNTFVTHQLIIPSANESVTIKDEVFTWKTSDTETIWFRVTVPANTPAAESISLQFQLGTWMPSLPMFKINGNTWAFPLISPHNFSGELPYRYCRNTPCTGEIQSGIEQLESPRLTTTRFQEVHLINDAIAGWAFLSDAVTTANGTENTTQRGEGFIAGLSLTPYYTPTGRSYIGTLLSSDQKPYNHVVFSPTWEAESPTGSQLIGPTLERTIPWAELTTEINTAHNNGLSVSLFPQVSFATLPLDWWQSFPSENEAYWQAWLDQYRQMVYQYAQLAEETGVETLVLGGDWLTPTLPIGDHAADYHLPGNIESLWTETISGVRSRFNGQIGWQITPEVADQPPTFLSDVDILYLEWDTPAEPYNSISELATQIGEKLDAVAEPLAANLGKPVYLVIAYPAIHGYSDACISSPNDEGSCINTAALLLEPSVENPALTDLDAQTDFYLAFLTAVDQRDWVDGVLSQGFYPVNQIHDTSASIHGKPAETIFQNWTAQVLGK